MIQLWKETSSDSAGTALRAKVSEIKAGINRQMASRGARAVNALRNAELNVLQGQRSGKVYHMPGTHGGATKATRELKKSYGHKLRGGQLYQASAPGEAPARRTGNLRMHWIGDVSSHGSNNGGVSLEISLESGEKYAHYLEEGKGMAARPFVDKIKEKAEPEIKKIFEEPYT